MSDAQGRPRSPGRNARMPESDSARVRQWARGRVPEEMLDQVRVEAEVHGPTITIVERRPPSGSGLGPEWTRQRIAQLRYDPESSLWTLCHSDRNQRWHVYDLPLSPDVQALIDEIDRDPTGIFWG